jgi:hypothetical protein
MWKLFRHQVSKSRTADNCKKALRFDTLEDRRMLATTPRRIRLGPTAISTATARSTMPTSIWHLPNTGCGSTA